MIGAGCVFPPLPADTELLSASHADGDLPSQSELDAALSQHGLSVTQDDLRATPGTTNEVGSLRFSADAVSVRTSTTWFCRYEGAAPLLCAARRLVGLGGRGTPLAVVHAEEPQVVRYRIGEEFSWHYDEVPPVQLGNGGQRIGTLLVYLSTLLVGAGGGMAFRDLKNAAGGRLAVRPVEGRALLFFPAFGDGRPDDRTLHAGEPVADGTTVQEKLVAQVSSAHRVLLCVPRRRPHSGASCGPPPLMWIHERPYSLVVPEGNLHDAAIRLVEAREAEHAAKGRR